MKKIILNIFMIFLLSACNSKGGGNAHAINSPSDEIDQSIIQKYNLPPEPSIKDIGFATLLGVDSNGERGRDDVEREIAVEFNGNDEVVHKLHQISELHLKAVNAMKKNDVEDFKKSAGEYTMYKRCYIFSFAESGAEDLEKLKSFLYDESRYNLSGSVSYDSGDYSSLSKTLQYCKDKGFNISF